MAWTPLVFFAKMGPLEFISYSIRGDRLDLSSILQFLVVALVYYYVCTSLMPLRPSSSGNWGGVVPCSSPNWDKKRKKIFTYKKKKGL